MKVTCCVPTKARYFSLHQTLLSIAFQTYKDLEVIIVDDNEQPVDLRTIPEYQPVFHLFNEYHIPWKVIFGRKQGQHHSHQMVTEMAETDWIWRIDDDEIAEPNVLETLIGTLFTHLSEDVGAVGSLVLPPSPLPVPPEAANTITDLNRPNVQWFRQPPRVIEVDHLHSTFLYRKGLVNYELSLSPAAHREETLFTYEFKRKGYKLLVDTSAVTWHFRAQGGIRSHHDPGFWNHDENVFAQKLLDWGVVTPRPEKIIVVDAGRGDHVMVKSLLPKIKKKYPDCLVATCFPDILDGEIPQISIEEARRNLGNLERHSIYGWCIEHNWTGNLVEAFEKMYELG